DYITKPFQMEELLARIRVALRFHPNEPAESTVEEIPHTLQFGDLALNEQTYEVYRGNDMIELTPREFDLLAYLMENALIVLNRKQILNYGWGYDYVCNTNVVDVYIRYLRNKIDKQYEHQLIHTVRGVGYVLKDEQ